MRRDDDPPPEVVLEEWLLALRGPADLDAERVAAARALVQQALASLARELAPQLAAGGLALDPADG